MSYTISAAEFPKIGGRGKHSHFIGQVSALMPGQCIATGCESLDEASRVWQALYQWKRRAKRYDVRIGRRGNVVYVTRTTEIK